MKHTRGRVLDVTTLADLDRRLAAGARSLAGWRVVGLDLTERGPALLERSLAQSLFLGCEFADGRRRRRTPRGRHRAARDPRHPGRPLPHDALLPARALRHRAATRTPSTRGRTPGRAARATPDDTLARALHDHQRRRGAGRLGPRARHRRRDGRARARARQPDVRRRGPARPRARRPPHRRHRRRAGRDGGGQPRRLRARRPRRRARPPSPGCRRSGPTSAPGRDAAFEVVDATPDGRESLGIPTWHYGHEPPNPFATSIAKYFRNAPARGAAARGLQRRHRLPARRRRHGAGGLPGRLRELLRRRVVGRADGAGRSARTGPRSCRSGRCCRPWPAVARWRPHVHLVDSVDEAVAVVVGELSRPGGD